MSNYISLREKIKDGDVVFVSGKGTLISKIIKLVTRSRFYHVGFAYWQDERLFMVEAYPGGRRIVTMSYYASNTLHVIQAPVPWADIKDLALDRTGFEGYGWGDFVLIGLKDLFGIKSGDKKGEVCSEMVAKVLKAKGVNVEPVISPAKLYRRLIDLNHVVRTVING